MRASSALSCLVLAAAGTLVAVPAEATSTPVPGCGATLTTDSRLTADLTCPSGDGLVLGEGVTLDLNGHTLTGSAGATAVIAPPLGDVTVRNGTIADWGFGLRTRVDDEIGGTLTVWAMTFRGNREGLQTDGRLGSTGKVHDVDRSTFIENGVGLDGFYGDATIRRSRFTANNTAIDVTTGGITLEKSRVDGNRRGIFCDESDCVVRRSTLVNNETAIGSATYSPHVFDSILRGNDTAVFSGGRGGRLERNRFLDNGTGVALRFSSATLRDNVFRDNELGFTIIAQDSGEDEPPALLIGNRFVHNGDAIMFEAPRVSLQDNVTHHNKRWGIYAPNATDLGGNTAWGNGYEPQCVGVLCPSGGPRS